MSVYIITARCCGLAKVGYSTDPVKRLNSCQVGSPVALRLEAVIPDHIHSEVGLHVRFNDYRRHGEWFAICADIEGLIETFSFDARVVAISSGNPPMCHADLLNLLGGNRQVELGCLQLGAECSAVQIGQWKRLNSVPAEYWPALIKFADRKGIKEITAEWFMQTVPPRKKMAKAQCSARFPSWQRRRA